MRFRVSIEREKQSSKCPLASLAPRYNQAVNQLVKNTSRTISSYSTGISFIVVCVYIYMYISSLQRVIKHPNSGNTGAHCARLTACLKGGEVGLALCIPGRCFPPLPGKGRQRKRGQSPLTGKERQPCRGYSQTKNKFPLTLTRRLEHISHKKRNGR